VDIGLHINSNLKLKIELPGLKHLFYLSKIFDLGEIGIFLEYGYYASKVIPAPRVDIKKQKNYKYIKDMYYVSKVLELGPLNDVFLKNYYLLKLFKTPSLSCLTNCLENKSNNTTMRLHKSI
jgi:hypothetical protein